MATLDTDVSLAAIQETIRQMERADLFTDEAARALLEAGSEVMLQSVRSAFVSAGHNRPGVARWTGETLRHIVRPKTLKKDKHGAPYMQVTITGKDRRAQRYGIKGFVLNYGRRRGGRITGDYYWTNAVKNTWGAANEAMSRKAAELMGGGN